MVLIVPIVQLFVSFAMVFVSCELSQHLTDEFDGIDEIFDQSDWYLFPFKIQQLLPTIMLNTQQPVYIKCFGGIPCNRQTFKKVCQNHCIFSNLVPMSRRSMFYSKLFDVFVSLGGQLWIFILYGAT